jgi:hypothetical protein
MPRPRGSLAIRLYTGSLGSQQHPAQPLSGCDPRATFRRPWACGFASMQLAPPISQRPRSTRVPVLAGSSAAKSFQSHGSRLGRGLARKCILVDGGRDNGNLGETTMWLLRRWSLLVVGMAIGIGMGITSAYYKLPAGLNFKSFVYYPNCSFARAAGAAPIHVGQPGYRHGLDADRDGVACEPYPRD